ncbi:hypothetical protein V2G26_011241 [Clonostachys chloroleuca]
MHLPYLLLAILAALRPSAAADTPQCNATCRGQIASDWEKEQHASIDFEFYNVPSNFSSSMTPGTLLRVEKVTNQSLYSVPYGLTLSRIMYTTTNLNGTVIPTSGYVLWPYSPIGSQNSGEGYNMVAWAHGTSGSFKSCAPSNYRNLQYHFMVPFLLALQGNIVVAPDYAGLGVDTLPSGEHIAHPWAAGPAQANDLANAIIAARKAFPEYLKPSGSFVAMGHSQGAETAWGFAERLVKQPIDGYKGTALIAPPTNVIKHIELALESPTELWALALLSGQPKIISSITATYPAYNYSGLSPAAYERWVNILKPLSGCFPTDSYIFSDLKPGELAQDGWTKDETVQKYSAAIDIGRKKFKGPLFIAAGTADLAVPIHIVNSVVDDTCAMLKQENWDESLEMITYADMSHFSIIQASQLQWLQWVKDRLSSGSKPLRRGCVKKEMSGFLIDQPIKQAFPNFLQGWASSDEGWKYSL